MKSEIEYAKPKNSPVSDQELINDLVSVSKKQNTTKISQKFYLKHGKFNTTTFINHFGTWNNALIQSGLELSNEIEISDERLFENLLNLWQVIGKQPARSDLINAASKFSQSPYLRRFGNWTNSLKSFIDFVNAADIALPENTTLAANQKRKANRDPSLRLRYRILKRDNFCCVACGASPAKNSEVELQLDHITAWNNGGETIEENL